MRSGALSASFSQINSGAAAPATLAPPLPAAATRHGAAKHAAETRNDEQPRQDTRKSAAELKSTVKQNHWQRKKAEPEVAAHPGLCAADAPRGDASPSSK